MTARSPAKFRALDEFLQKSLEALQGVVPSVALNFVPRSRGATGADGELTVRMPGRGRSVRFLVQAVRTNLSYVLASGIIEQARRARGNCLVFAPYVPAPIGRHLASNGVSYADVVGNCHLETAFGLLVHVEGKKPIRQIENARAGRLPSYQVLFAILAQPELLEHSVRQIALAAGVGKTAAADQLQRFAQQGLIERTPRRKTIVNRRELLARWLAGYSDIVRPAWLAGRYQTQSKDPQEVEHQIAEAWRGNVWAFGGGAAAWRLAPFYRGAETLIHVDSVAPDALRRIRAVPAKDGTLTILRTPGTVAYASVEPHLAHPLLIYTEMIGSSDPRMREAAADIRERFWPERS